MITIISCTVGLNTSEDNAHENNINQTEICTLSEKEFERSRKRLWYLLRNRGLKDFKFKKQQVIASYIVDFLCIKEKLIIEVDGGQHAQTVAYDHQRTRFLQQKGFKVIRFWNNEVLGETEAVLNEILEQLKKKNSEGIAF